MRGSVGARRVLRALVALPRWIVSRFGRGRGDAHVASARRGVVGAVTGFVLAIVANLAAIVCAFVVGRAIYYPFWAAGATHEELARSWGGPSAIGATLVHWLVAAATFAIMYALISVTERAATHR